MHSLAGLIRRTSPPTFSDTAITDRHSDTTIFQFRAHWVRLSWSIGSEKSFGRVPPVGVEPSTSCMQGGHPIHLARLSAEPFLLFVFDVIYSVCPTKWLRHSFKVRFSQVSIDYSPPLPNALYIRDKDHRFTTIYHQRFKHQCFRKCIIQLMATVMATTGMLPS